MRPRFTDRRRRKPNPAIDCEGKIIAEHSCDFAIRLCVCLSVCFCLHCKNLFIEAVSAGMHHTHITADKLCCFQTTWFDSWYMHTYHNFSLAPLPHLHRWSREATVHRSFRMQISIWCCCLWVSARALFAHRDTFQFICFHLSTICMRFETKERCAPRHKSDRMPQIMSVRNALCATLLTCGRLAHGHTPARLAKMEMVDEAE